MQNSHKEIIEASLEAGRRVWIYAEGNPARILAVGFAGAVITAGTYLGLNLKRSFFRN